MAGTPRRGTRPLILAVAAGIGLALGVGNAGGDDAINTTVPQLQAPESLPQAPSVPDVPDAPSAPQTPSAPEVPPAPKAPSAPSAPAAPAADVPSVPETAGGSSGATAGGVGGDSTGSTGASNESASGGSGSASPRVRAARAKLRAAQRDARADRVKRERRLRTVVARLSGCLDLLPSREGRFLAMRAGVGGARPMSRRDAASRAGIPRTRADTAERRGLKRLRRAARAGGCGAGSAGSTVALTGSAGPQLQPAVLMAPAPPLRDTAELSRERQGVKGVSESSGTAAADAEEPRSLVTPISDAIDGGTMAGWYVLLGAAVLVALLLLISRRGRLRREPAYPTAPPEWFMAPPVPEQEPEPRAPETVAESTSHPVVAVEHDRRRQAALAAGSLASLALTAFARRRRRR